MTTTPLMRDIQKLTMVRENGLSGIMRVCKFHSQSTCTHIEAARALTCTEQGGPDGGSPHVNNGTCLHTHLHAHTHIDAASAAGILSMSIGDSKAGMGFDHPVMLKVLLGPNSVVDRRFLPPRRAAHRECRALAPGPAFTHRISVFTHRISAISAISTVGMLMCACDRQFSTRANR
jgi:hypothetical protein